MIPLCSRHKELCDNEKISVQELWEIKGTKCIPPQMYKWLQYDRWGNPLFADGTRSKGELYDEADVQAQLRQQGKLGLFGERVRYPKTFVLPWSESMSEGDDRMRSIGAMEGSEVVVTEKFDGQNVTLYRDSIFFRSIAVRSHPSRRWLEEFWEDLRTAIPKGWRICGEYLFLSHTVSYADLASFFVGFSVWNEENICLSWAETESFFQEAGVEFAPVLYRGRFDRAAIDTAWSERSSLNSEGYVLRAAERIRFRDFKEKVGKFIRAGYVQSDPLRGTDDAAQLVINRLSSDGCDGVDARSRRSPWM